MAPYSDLTADCVLTTFRSLSQKYKPRSKEWVPIAGIVLKRDTHNSPHTTEQTPPTYNCVALATGMKCHPSTTLEHLHGCGLHDWHAEVLAIRAFNRFLVDECADLAAGTLGRGSAWLRWKSNGEREHLGEEARIQPFELRDDVSIHMFVSEAPCGDASMELTMAKQEDATPWTQMSEDGIAKPDQGTSSSETSMQTTTSTMHGRGHFDQLGKVRRKPSRPDAPATLSKSCSDKLALKQCTSLLSALTTQLIRPQNVYLTSVVLPESEVVPEACERAFGTTGRMASLTDKQVQEDWKKMGFGFKPFEVQTTKREFEYSKRYLSHMNPGYSVEPVPSNRSCVYTPRSREVLINGVLEGRRWYDRHGASVVSRRSMWKSVLGVATALGLPNVSYLAAKCSYGELKASGILSGREKVKVDVKRLALHGWVKNEGDEGWTLSEEEKVATLVRPVDDKVS